MKLSLKNPHSCDGCPHLKNLGTLGGHQQCETYKLNMLPIDDVSMVIRRQEGKDTGKIERPQICKDENDD